MIKLQSNFTTPEQSIRLLELGLPADSADCYHGKLDVDMSCVEIRQDSFELKESLFYNDDSYYPCWSVGRLIEIYKICNPADSLLEAVHLGLNFDLITILMTSFEAAIGVGCMDFSKLEE